MAIRISNNLKKVMVKLKLQIKLYNNLKGESLKYPNTLDFENVKDQEAPIWKDQMNNISEVADVPNSIKHQCIELLSTIMRCKEEQSLIEEEMSSSIAWMLNEYNHLNDLVEQSILTSAKKSVVIKEAMIIETDLNMLNTLFKTYIGVSEVPCTYCSYVFGTEDELCKILEEYKETEEICLEESDSELESENESDVDESEDEEV